MVKKLKLDWFVSYDENFISFKSFQTFSLVPHLEVVVGCSLEFFVIVFGWTLPDDHHLYKEFFRSVRHISISKLLNKVKSLQMCNGITCDLVDCNKDSNLINHSVPHKFDFNNEKEVPFKANDYKRHKDCYVINTDNEKCVKCSIFEINFNKSKASTSKKLDQPAHLNAPLSVTHPNRIKLALMKERSENKKLMHNIERMQKEIEFKAIQVSPDLSSDLNIIISKNQDNMTPFMKLFWEEQNRLSLNKMPRYHPMIIRFCLSLASKSASAYDELRDTNILTLPSRRTLRDYKNAIQPSVGFNQAVIAELRETTKDLTNIQRNVVLSFDEIRIQDNLVFDKSSGELIGYVDLGDPEINFSTFKDVNDLATHCLVYYIRGIACDLKFCLAYFATNGVTAVQIMPTFWKAVSILELCCKLKVIIAVSDGASSNRSFYKMHSGLDNLDDSDVVYRTINLFAPGRYIYFFADAPHLMKTFRNCMYHSGDGKYTRTLWNRDQSIIWYHIVKIVQDELNNGLKILPKLSYEHVHLNSYSAMSVRYATQVLSASVANVLYKYYPPETHVTAELCSIMDRFFDCLNVRNQNESLLKKKTDLKPYRDLNDVRFDWLLNEFLNYFSSWKECVKNRKGNFTQNARDCMFISRQTYEGLLITVRSFVESTRFLLSEGMPFVLSERFNQDVLEEYFGRQRSLGRRNDNPTVIQFGYQSNTLRMQRSIAPVTGNTKGSQKQKRRVSWKFVDNAPLKKRSTKK
ncbi:uncharacterized protein LOC136090694 [Hydra vulgaris]|uniref:Uncharacterized protein LOC136090694 n=1 Tax=Hydra vulgaris TaxID=6087 RepID=A0ABM4DGM5_HYDVU